MALPTLDFPKYELIIPSTGETLVYRAFLVKEQKLILQAIEMSPKGDTTQLNHAIEDVLKECTFNAFDMDNAPLYDVEFVLLQIRAKSAGEIVEMIYRCNHVITGERYDDVCGGQINVDVPLTMAEIVKPEEHEYRIMLTDKIGMTMRDLPYGKYKMASGMKGTEAGFSLIKACVENIFDEDNVFGPKDFTDREFEVFLDQFDVTRFAKIEKFIETMPFLELKLPMRCPKCSTRDSVTLKGLDDFLA